jgi:hypothetical protein
LLLGATLAFINPPAGATLTVNALAVSVACRREIAAASDAEMDSRNAIVETAVNMALARSAKGHAAACLSLIWTPQVSPQGHSIRRILWRGDSALSLM